MVSPEFYTRFLHKNFPPTPRTPRMWNPTMRLSSNGFLLVPTPPANQKISMPRIARRLR